MPDVVIDVGLCDFVEFETFDPAAIDTPVVIGVDHIEWGFSVFEAEVQGGGAPPGVDVVVTADLLDFVEFETFA